MRNKVMKANEAPENIYLTKNLLGELRDGWDAQPSEVFTNIEYIRTDAFFKKLEEWMAEYISDLASVDTRILVGSFKNYMEGKL